MVVTLAEVDTYLSVLVTWVPDYVTLCAGDFDE